MPHAPVRMCVICRQRLPKAELTRYVLSPEGQPQVDPRRNMPGRGWYLCSQPACRERFQKYALGRRKRGKK